jgi:hypothetical protein
MLYEILQNPLNYLKYEDAKEPVFMNVHRSIPERVPVGHFTDQGEEIVDETIPRAEYLDRIQQVCAALGERFGLRFYDHTSDVFDATLLDHLSEVRTLAIDSLGRASNLDAVARLPKLKDLRFGPAFAEGADALARMGVERLVKFTLAGSPSPPLDLTPLGRSTSLRELRLLGRGKNTAAIGAIPSLRELALHPSPKESLEFVGGLQGLEVLKLVLGRKESIADVPPLPNLRDLSCFEVALLQDLGDLQRFPSLRRLQLSDLKRLPEIVTGPGNQALEHMRLYSVPGLHTVHGLSALPALKTLWAYDSRLTPAWSELPRSLTHFQLVTKAMKGRKEHEAEVRAYGLIPDLPSEAEFFYK